MLDRIAAKHNRKLHEHGIGFKYVVDLMLAQPILIGGEESGGIGISKHLPGARRPAQQPAARKRDGR